MLTVPLNVREDFKKAIGEFKTQMDLFLDGKGMVPATSTEEIKNKYVNISVVEMTRYNGDRHAAKRISRNTLDTILSDLISY